jgi:penicillin-binding protein 1C
LRIAGIVAIAPPVIFVAAAFLVSLADIRLRNYSPSWIVLDRNYRFIAEIESPRGGIGYWPAPDTLPRTLVTAVLAAEDRRFRKHIGVDAMSVGRALVNNYIRRKGFSGASTIAMQTARLQRGGGSGLFSKVRDSFAAVWLTVVYGRDKVLKQYVSISPYGNRIAGAPCASRRYFRKPVQDLSLAESALLVSIPRAPGRMNMFKPAGFAAARSRAQFVLRRCLGYGWIDSTEYRQSMAELKEFAIPPKDIRDESVMHATLRYKSMLHGSSVGIDGKGKAKTRSGINNSINDNINNYYVDDNIRKQGLVVSSIDIDLQMYIQSELADYLERYKAGDVENGAIIVVDKSNSQVLAYVGSGGYFHFKGGMHDYAATKRSTGSLMKPFIFAYGMEELGYTAATVLRDINYDFGEGNRSFIPANSDREYLGPILYKYALANSRNIPAVQVLKALGVNSVYKRLADLKLTDDDGRGSHYGLGLSIGGLYCDLTSISRAYLTLGNEGRFSDLAWFKDDAAEHQGKPINSGGMIDQYPANNRYGKLTSGSGAADQYGDPANRQTKQVMSPEAALMIQRFLSDPLARLPTFPREGFFEYPFAVAVKTGTSDGFRDAWCVAWSGRYLVAAWMGNADNHPTKRVSGYNGPAPIVKKIMLRLHPQERDGLSESGFPAPDGWKPISICRLTGLRADMNTPYVTSDYFAPGTEPTGASEVLRVLPVDTRNGLLAGLSCPEKFREFRSFLSLAPEYEPWARAYGLPAAPRLQSPLCPGERLPIDYRVEITWPRSGARFFIDPEMPEEQAFLPVNCVAEPEAESVLWFVNGEEHSVTNPPHTLRLPMKSGKYAVQAGVAGTPVRSRVVRVEVY